MQTPKQPGILSRFQFYLPISEGVKGSRHVSDQENPPEKKLKVHHPKNVVQATNSTNSESDTSVRSNNLISLDRDGDLIIERQPISNSSECSDSDSGEDDKAARKCDDKSRDHEDQELCVITLRHSLATELNQVGEQVWLGALLLCDYIIHKASDFRDKIVIDLGSGTGLTSIVAAIFADTVYCTDVGQNILGLAKHNVDNQTMFREQHPCCIHVRELDWFKPVTACEGGSSYGLTSGDVTGIYKAQIIIAADVVYDNDITDAFVNTVTKLLSKPPSKRLLVGLEKRLVFTIEDLDIASPGYDHFRKKLNDLELSSCTEEVIYKVEQVYTDFPQYFQYNRTKQLVRCPFSSFGQSSGCAVALSMATVLYLYYISGNPRPAE